MPEPLHGGRVYAEARALGVDPSAFLDFSANLNPLGPPASVLARLHTCLASSLPAYPDQDSPGLVEGLARRHGAKPGHVVVGNGGTALLHLALRVGAPEVRCGSGKPADTVETACVGARRRRAGRAGAP